MMWMLATAFATQSVPADEFGGTWDLWCESAAVTIDIGVGATLAGASSDWSHQWTLDLACSTPRATLRRIARDTFVGCTRLGLPRASCRDTALEVTRQLEPLHSLGTTWMPVQADLIVGETTNPWTAITGIYPVYGTHTWLDGHSVNWDYLLDANDGPTWGHLASFGIGLGPGSGQNGAGCTTLGSAAIDAWLDPVAGDLTATWAQDQRVLCAAVASDGSAVALTVGVRADGEMGGAPR